MRPLFHRLFHHYFIDYFIDFRARGTASCVSNPHKSAVIRMSAACSASASVTPLLRNICGKTLSIDQTGSRSILAQTNLYHPPFFSSDKTILMSDKFHLHSDSVSTETAEPPGSRTQDILKFKHGLSEALHPLFDQIWRTVGEVQAQAVGQATIQINAESPTWDESYSRAFYRGL
jgi:hypothetical protein